MKISKNRVLYLVLMTVLFLFGSCVNRKPIKIGLIVELSGPFRDLGIEGRDGALMAVEEINSAGGIGGRPLELVIADCGSTPEEATAALDFLEVQKVAALLGPMTSGQCEVIYPRLTESAVPCIGITTASETFSGRKDSFFRVIPSTTQMGHVLADHLLQENFTGSVAVVFDLANENYTRSLLTGFSRALKEQGYPAPLEIPFDSRKPEFPESMTEAVAVRPSVIFIIASARDTALLAQYGRVLGFDGRYISAGWAGTEDLIQKGGQAVEGMELPFFFFEDRSNQSYSDFKERFVRRYGKDPIFSSIYGYEALAVMAAAMTRQTREGGSLKDNLNSLETYPAVIGKASFDEFGDIVREMTIVRVENGQFVLMHTNRKAY